MTKHVEFWTLRIAKVHNVENIVLMQRNIILVE